VTIRRRPLLGLIWCDELWVGFAGGMVASLVFGTVAAVVQATRPALRNQAETSCQGSATALRK
jgi:hypothetical protein